MRKLLFFISFLFAAPLTAADVVRNRIGDAILVSVDWVSFDGYPEKPVTLEEFFASEEVDRADSNGTLDFEIFGDADGLNAERIAEKVWYAIDPRALNFALPCGQVLLGEKTVKETSFANFERFEIFGMGDGYINTCTGQKGPGAWAIRVAVEMDPSTKHGKIHFMTGRE